MSADISAKVNFIVNENKPLSPGENINILKELATLDPLEDRAFKILLSDDAQFALLAEAFTGQKIDEDCIIDINGEIVFTVKGRLIRLDSLRDTSLGYVNMEGQIVATDFPYKRHIFHSAAIYVNGIQKSDSWQDLKPVVSIVVYKDKGEASLIETAFMSGDLVKGEDDRKQLHLVAINTKKWNDAKSADLKIYLSTLHYGILTEDNKSRFANVDIDDPVFVAFQSAVKRACATTKQQEYKEKGDDFMATQYATFITEEEKQAAIAKGYERTRMALRLLKEDTPVAEVAKMCQMTVREVENLRNDLVELRRA